MFKDSQEGQTNSCTHTNDNTICDMCLGKLKCPKCGKRMKLDKENSGKYHKYWSHCGYGLSIG